MKISQFHFYNVHLLSITSKLITLNYNYKLPLPHPWFHYNIFAVSMLFIGVFFLPRTNIITVVAMYSAYFGGFHCFHHTFYALFLICLLFHIRTCIGVTVSISNWKKKHLYNYGFFFQFEISFILTLLTSFNLSRPSTLLHKD